MSTIGGTRATNAGGTPVLALNAGSSSVKFGFYRIEGPLARCAVSGEIEIDADGQGRLAAQDADGAPLMTGGVVGRGPTGTLASIRDLLCGQSFPAPSAIGHRVVHGGPRLVRHALIDPEVLEDLEAATAYAPLHMPVALGLLHAARECFPDAAQVACLDTAFHANLPELARTLPIPRELREAGIHRYGFHGLSCESIVRQLGTSLPSRLVIAHLGNGASVTGVLDGRSVDTSMGFTPSGGTIMGTRCGDIDPGVLAYLMREQGYDAARIEALIDHRGGLLGISGLSSDMRALHAAAGGHPDARMAIAMFVRSVAKQVAAMTVALAGIDLLVFTGGIGEHDALVRDAVCRELVFLDVRQPGLESGACAVRAMRTDEEMEIAMHALELAHDRESSNARNTRPARPST